jgi:hypothetical protein
MLLGIVPLAFMAVWYVFYVFHYERAPQKLTLLGIAVSMASTLFVYFQRHHIDTAVKVRDKRRGDVVSVGVASMLLTDTC